jgi:succinate dehydrogenase / fumarate reductase cytochrome b subunit
LQIALAFDYSGPQMERTISLYETTIGKKAVVAVTGAVLYGFVIVHMLGNLQIFLGPEKFNGYAASLKGNPILLWGVRGTLLVSVALHVLTSLTLVGRTASARSVGYRAKDNLVTSWSAITMKYGGPAILLYILFHLAHFTWPGIAMGRYRHSATDAYSNFVHGFQVPWVTAVYVVAQFFLGMHLYHGAYSLFQTLGLNHGRYNRIVRSVPRVIGVGVAAANIAMPLSVLAGIVK